MVRKRLRVEPTDDWGQLELLLKWPEQREYELIHPIVVSGGSVAERVRETGAASESKLRRNANLFEKGGMEPLFATKKAKRKRLSPCIRTMIVKLKGEHPPLNPNEVAAIVYVRTGRHKLAVKNPLR